MPRGKRSEDDSLEERTARVSQEAREAELARRHRPEEPSLLPTTQTEDDSLVRRQSPLASHD